VLDGRENRKTTRPSSSSSTDSRILEIPRPRAGWASRNSKVKTTSAARKGFPSDHRTPSRIVKVRPLAPSCHAYSVASQGTYSPVIRLKMRRGS
jgi:hypothetical protein